jgi:hypothetical protein
LEIEFNAYGSKTRKQRGLNDVVFF